MTTGLENGAIGGKVCGAGGGGCIVFYARENEKPRLARALEQIGGRILPFAFDTTGVVSW
jgi:D-glycero-alpha-D-manno-heptose-7-phosphate kinase